jgi:biopolymer transport protein ExbB
MKSFVVSLAVAAALIATSAFAADAPAVSLDDLLRRVESARRAESQENAQRVEEFKTARDRQARLLEEAKRDLASAEAESKRLTDQMDANDVEIANLKELLRQRQGSLGELFGVTRQVAADAANTLDQSMITARYPDRVEFLRTTSTAKELPTITELERLWFEIQREMTETGKVLKYEGDVLQPDGTAVKRPITRVGPFTASTEGEFLAWGPALGKLQVLPRQPTGEWRGIAADLEEASSGYVNAVVDPGRGVMVQLYGERPDFAERIEQGEFVGYVIIAVGIVGALVWLFQFFYLIVARIKVARQLGDIDKPVADNALGRVLLAFKGDAGRIEEQADVAELRISEAVLREVPKLERFQAFLRLAVAAGPLLGLIGTVIGMIVTFQSITESGSSDPKLMAHGISQAMIATVLGLGIAIPLLFANAILTSLSRQIVQLLDEQSAGLLAQSIERRNG